MQKQNALAKLAGQAYSAPVAQQNALVSQMVGIDPQSGMEMGSALAGRAQAQEVDHAKRVGGAARYMAQALQSKNPAQIEGAYQAVRPYLAELGAQLGKVPPDHWDPSMEAGVQQIIAQTGGMPEMKGVVLSAGGQLRNPQTGESIEISARRVLTFRPSQVLRAEVNAALEGKPITPDSARRHTDDEDDEDDGNDE